MFNVGDKVIISNKGNIFSAYKQWAEKYNLTLWKNRTFALKCEGTIGTIVCKGQHLRYNEMLYGVNITVNGVQEEIIIGEKGLSKPVGFILATPEEIQPELKEKFSGPFPTLQEFLGI